MNVHMSGDCQLMYLLDSDLLEPFCWDKEDMLPHIDWIAAVEKFNRRHMCW